MALLRECRPSVLPGERGSATAVALAALVMALGLVGTVLPMLPGLPLIWAGALLYGLIEEFGIPGVVAMTAITILFAGGSISKYLLAQRGARAHGATKSTMLAGALFGFVGFFAIPVVGFIVGAVLGVLVAEHRRLGDWSRAWASTKGVLAGYGIGVLFEVGAGLLMIGCWVAWVLLAP